MSDALQDLFGLTGKRAIVTGAGAGIGRATAERLAEAGASVALVDLDRARAAAAAEEIASACGVKTTALEADVGDEVAVARMVEGAASDLGGVDILVNNAGIYPEGSVAEMDVAVWDRVMATNLRGPLLCMREVAKVMRSQGQGGAVINVSSTESFHPSFVGLAAYGTSKGGINMLTKNAALEFAPDGIRVNAVCPGGTVTEGTRQNIEDGMGPELEKRIPLSRLAQPGEIGGVILFLAGPAAGYITGATLLVDGGYMVG